jgi:DNA polymerase-3 subunit gamma/tau
MAPASPAAQAQTPTAVPPWEDIPPRADAASAQAAPQEEQSVPRSAAPTLPAEQPDVPGGRAGEPVAAQAAEGPPAWVDEAIPDDADVGYVPEDSFTADPDDEFETLAAGGSPAMPSPAMPARVFAAARPATARGPRLADMSSANWPELAARLPVTGLAAEVARQSEWQGVQGDTITLRLAVKTLADSASRLRLQTVLCEHFGQGIRLEVQVGATGDATAHAVAQHERAARQQAAEEAAAADPFVRSLVADFGGRIVPGSIRHVEPPRAAA